MRKVFTQLSSLMVVMILIIAAAAINTAVSARDKPADLESVSRGAQLYDDWSKLSSNAAIPEGNHPLWSQQTTNTQSGEDTWKCVTCHGWDYQGKDGANRTGAYATGFPGILASSQSTEPEIIAILKGEEDPDHDFSAYLADQDMLDLAAFITDGLINDNEFIDLVSRKVISGDMENGKTKYDSQCASCHGQDGSALAFRYEGTDVSLATLAIQDPWRLLHRTRYGTARAPEMPLGVNLNWTPQDGRDVLYYVQSSLPSGLEAQASTPEEIEPVENQGGPAKNILTGILTAFGAMGVSLGFAVLLGAVFIGVILLVVWLIRNQKS